MLFFPRDFYYSKGAILVPFFNLPVLKYLRIIHELQKELSVTASKKFMFLDVGKASHTYWGLLLTHFQYAGQHLRKRY